MQIIKKNNEIEEVVLIRKGSRTASKQDKILENCQLLIRKLALLVVNWRVPFSVHRLLVLYIFLIRKIITRS